MLYERFTYLTQKYPTETDFIEMLKNECSKIGEKPIIRIPLLKLEVSPINFLGVSLIMAPLRKAPAAEPNLCALFSTVHTAHPPNRINLKHISQLEELNALAFYAQNMPHKGFKQFFERNFGETQKETPTISKLSMPKIQASIIHGKEESEWKPFEISAPQTNTHTPHEIHDIAMRELGELSYEQLNAELLEILKEKHWNHYALFHTQNLFFVLSTTKHESFIFGFMTGGTPKNYLKLRKLSLLTHLCDLLDGFHKMTQKHPHIYQAISKYQNNAFPETQTYNTI
ncbi:MAG: hypothetical protein QXP58_09785 [Thermoprotei archaeon]